MDVYCAERGPCDCECARFVAVPVGWETKSSLHRVVPHPDALNRTKYTIVYLKRPETKAAFIDGDGKEWKSKDWYLKKFEVFGQGEVDESQSSVLTGRKDYDG